MKAVVCKMPPITEYPGMVAERLRSKSSKLGSAPRALSHVNLIIFDRDCRLGSTPMNDFYRLILTPELKQALIETGYREVFLVTTVKERNQCYFPLRLLLLSAETFQMMAALREFYEKVTWDEAVELCAELLGRRALLWESTLSATTALWKRCSATPALPPPQKEPTFATTLTTQCHGCDLRLLPVVSCLVPSFSGFSTNAPGGTSFHADSPTM
jgi:hypothetical protein